MMIWLQVKFMEVFQRINCVELNELPNDGKNNNTYEDEIIDWNECPIDKMGVIEEHEDKKSIENEFEPFVRQCFPNEEKAFIFYKNYANRYGFIIWKGHNEKKRKKKREK